MYYANIFDVLAQHHPEYVALAWGAMKFLFVAILNHESAIANLAKALARIADALPRMKLATILYPTIRMMTVMEELYAHVIQFLIRAHDWYREGTFRHILHSITRPSSYVIKICWSTSRIVHEILNSSPSLDRKWNYERCTQ
jgi:hypothetical protein